MSFERASGVLAHPTSFPGPHGIGDLGGAAFRFVDWLALAGQRLWQVMPLGPTGYGNSPYSSPSSYAGNSLLISLDWLVGDGLLEADDLGIDLQFPDYDVDFGRVIGFKASILHRAFDRFRAGAASHMRADLDEFCIREAVWLDDFALFMAIKEAHGGSAWSEWEEPIRLRQPAALSEWRQRLDASVRYNQFVQFLFRRQWSELKNYANARSVRIIGDIPIFVAHDSVEVWTNRHLFFLDEHGAPTVVAGVPPDPFSATGQTWGNPVYNWGAVAAEGYNLWIERVRTVLATVDIIRIDHFRGFAAAWVVPAGAPTAAAGRWYRGPGTDIFTAIHDALGETPFIVEDLGVITPDVVALRESLGLPGMSVLQFGFEGDPSNVYLPHNYDRNTVVYSATHDNQTTIGWFYSLLESERQTVQRYIGNDGSDIAWDLLRLALASVANTAILALQDIMRLGDEARMNVPGRTMGNWGWRFLPHQLHDGLAAGLGELTATYGRRVQSQRVRAENVFDYTVPNTGYPAV